ncbi:YtxH domain-containing protein [Mangrovibacillus cuniculi]|uniref:YtxH domain-containing protein n=1 Tax=Mangrovibacillus cuniculi TaxID=2593652 RepID=A0A7S8C9Q3_9BACI|nr:YtxH domain-containing protein [Mangrovibacillus cuniculi]QPC45990.1 YtxH domain-containing protein [Mangrovibacillus cuniculi]
MKTSSLLLGLFVGGLAGAVTTLLSTPSSGEQVRHNVKRSAEEWKVMLKDVNQSIQSLSSSIAYATREGKETIQQLVTDIKFAVQDWKESVDPHQHALKEEMDDIQFALAQLEKELQKLDNLENDKVTVE